jgi:hypothetical protein
MNWLMQLEKENQQWAIISMTLIALAVVTQVGNFFRQLIKDTTLNTPPPAPAPVSEEEEEDDEVERDPIRSEEALIDLALACNLSMREIDHAATWEEVVRLAKSRLKQVRRPDKSDLGVQQLIKDIDLGVPVHIRYYVRRQDGLFWTSSPDEWVTRSEANYYADRADADKECERLRTDFHDCRVIAVEVNS